VAIGALRFDDCLIEVSGRNITPGADGILSAALFEAFRMRVDARRDVMELTPDEDAQPSNAIGLRNLMLVKTMVGGREGWFLLDSGAAYSSVSRAIVPPAMGNGRTTELVGVRGALSGAYRLGPLSLGVVGQTLVDLSPVVLDLAPLSAREGVEISGVLGYSALSRRPFTVDFRHGVVTLE
jgi:hypothetical protein